MTTPKVTTRYNKKYGDRFYVHKEDETGKEIEVPGVSAIKGMLASPALTNWAKRETAWYCIDNLEAIQQLARNDRMGAKELVQNSTKRYSDAAASRGTDVHAQCEQVMRAIIAGEKPHFWATSDDLKYLRNFARFIYEFEVKPLQVETTIWSKEYEYAGTFDFLGMIKGWDEPVIVDWKTGASGVYPDHGLQQTGYRWADHYIDEEGQFQKFDSPSATFALWLRPDGWTLYELRSDQVMWDMFRNLRELYRYKMVVADTVVSRPLNEHPLARKWKGKR